MHHQAGGRDLRLISGERRREKLEFRPLDEPAPPAAAWGPRRGRRVSGEVAILADNQAAPRCLCPSEPPQAGDGVRAVGRASQGGTASSRCSAHAEGPEKEVGPRSTAQIRYGGALTGGLSGSESPISGGVSGELPDSGPGRGRGVFCIEVRLTQADPPDRARGPPPPARLLRPCLPPCSSHRQVERAGPLSVAASPGAQLGV